MVCHVIVLLRLLTVFSGVYVMVFLDSLNNISVLRGIFSGSVELGPS